MAWNETSVKIALRILNAGENPEKVAQHCDMPQHLVQALTFAPNLPAAIAMKRLYRLTAAKQKKGFKKGDVPDIMMGRK